MHCKLTSKGCKKKKRNVLNCQYKVCALVYISSRSSLPLHYIYFISSPFPPTSLLKFVGPSYITPLYILVDSVIANFYIGYCFSDSQD